MGLVVMPRAAPTRPQPWPVVARGRPPDRRDPPRMVTLDLPHMASPAVRDLFHLGGCTEPVRLTGHTATVDTTTGEVLRPAPRPRSPRAACSPRAATAEPPAARPAAASTPPTPTTSSAPASPAARPFPTPSAPTPGSSSPSPRRPSAPSTTAPPPRRCPALPLTQAPRTYGPPAGDAAEPRDVQARFCGCHRHCLAAPMI